MLTKKQRERRVFERLADIAGLPVVSGSVQQPDPPRPDIECVIDDHGPLAVELVALDAEDTRTRLNNMLATEDAWQAALSLWPSDLQTRLRTECQDVSLGLRIHNDAGSRLRTKLLRDVQKRLLSLPTGFAGELFGPGELPDLLYEGRVDRGRFRNGPRLIAPSAGAVLPVQIEKLVEKLTVRSYDTGLPLELFAYSVHDEVGAYHGAMEAIDDCLHTYQPGSMFRRVRVFDFGLGRVVR